MRVLEHILAPEVKSGKIEFRTIEGLTIENRAAKLKALPDEVVTELHKCQAVLKGPTTTPQRGDPWPNIESANVAMRRELDLFANVRPVRVPSQGIDWIFFRENTEGGYILGSRGLRVTDDLGLRLHGRDDAGQRSADPPRLRAREEDRPQPRDASCTRRTSSSLRTACSWTSPRRSPRTTRRSTWDDWIVDIMTAALVNPQRRTQFSVVAAPNLYGDIITDEAAEFQGGVGTAGSANLGKANAMFEAIHGSAPRMVNEGRAQYANPTSMIVAGKMLLDHMGYADRARKLDMALDICGQYEKKLVMTGRDTGATGADYANYIMSTLQDPQLEQRWQQFAGAAK